MKAECAPDGANNEHEAQAGGEVINLSDALSREQAENAARRPRMWNDAEVLGDLDAPEAQAVLAMRPVVGLTNHAPRVSGSGWTQRADMDWREWLDVLTRHPERADKGGNAFFFAESDTTGRKHTGHALCYRLKDRMRHVHAVAADFDGGCTIESVVERIRARGLFALIYTTHSHTTKGAAGSDRFRVLLPLSEPFDLSAGDYQALYVGLMEELAPDGADWDFTASRPSQLMYAPARPEGAAFKHYVIAGRALDLSTVTPGDVSPYRKRGPSGSHRGAAHDGEPAFLSDGFDLMAWHGDHGEYFDLSLFLEMIGWDVLSPAGDGYEITCPNADAHTSGGDTAWAIDGPDADNGAAIYCHHSHCADLRTWDFLRQLEDAATLPDSYDQFSDLLCDAMFYPDSVDDVPVEVNRADYVEEHITIEWLKTPKAVERAFRKLGDHSSEDAFAALYAGVIRGGNKKVAADRLAALVTVAGRFDANARKRLEKRGRDLLAEDRKAYAAEKAEERQEELAQALTRADLANPSLDPAEPLGDTMEEALATLGKRYAPVDLGGKFRLVRKPDLSAFGSEIDSTIIVYGKQDFLDLHLDRQLSEGDKLVNPAQVFLETEKRRSGIVFAPPPQKLPGNEFNMYQGRKLKAKAGAHGDTRDFPTLHSFIRDIVCDGDPDKLEWLTLWMAHMVQRPGEKPGTAVIGIGKGGVGKGMFGHLLSKLAAPHFKQLENEGHVTSQFAGEHMSKCILVVVHEAVFGASPKVSALLKAHVDGTTVQVEVKGFSLVTVLSFTRFYFDSNDAVPVLIENNGSERRYFVIRFSDAHKGDKAYFKDLYAAIEGDEMAALLSYLEAYKPADAGLDWADVRTAPETEERVKMGVDSLSGPMLRLKEVLEEGEVTLTTPEGAETFTADAEGLKVPVALFRNHIGAAGRKDRAEDRDVEAMFARLRPGVELGKGQGAVGSEDNKRWWRFPTECLGSVAEAPETDEVVETDEGEVVA